MRNKSDFFSIYMSFENMIFTQFKKKTECFRTDVGGELSSAKLKEHLDANGVLHQLTCPYTPQQAGVVERRHRSIVEIDLTLLF